MVKKHKKAVKATPASSLPPEPPGLRRQCRLIFIITLLLFLVPLPHQTGPDGELTPILGGHFLLTKSGAGSWNDQARIATVESLAERGTLAIEHSKWGWITGDKALLREHFYSTKPPLLSAVGAAGYIILRESFRLATGHELTYRSNEDVIYPWVTLTTSGLAFALLLVFFYRALHLVEISPRARWWVFWALAIGSLYPAYSTIFNNHTVAGSGVFIAFYYVLRHRLGGTVKWWEWIIGGLFVAFAGVNDFTGALPFVGLFFVVLALHDAVESGLWPAKANQRGLATIWVIAASAIALGMVLKIGPRGTAILLFSPIVIALLVSIALAFRRRPASFLFLIGILLPVVAHLFLNSRVTGNWLPTYIQSDVYIAVPPGYFGEVVSPEEAGVLFWARWKYIGTALFGIRGIFIYTPTLLIGLWFAVRAIFTRGDPLRSEAVATILAVLAGWGGVLLFASPNFGGTSFGFRYALTATPLLIFFCHRVFAEGVPEIVGSLFRNCVAWGALVGLIALPYPWGIFGYLPATQCSIVGNIEYIALNFIFAFQ